MDRMFVSDHILRGLFQAEFCLLENQEHVDAIRFQGHLLPWIPYFTLN